jgi:phosphatidylglycerophosphatase A
VGIPIRLRLTLATGFGAGYAPIAPGTVGSLPGLLLVWLLAWLGGHPAAVVGFVAVVLLGVWAADAAEAHFGERDPGQVVIDEIAGQMLTLLFVPLSPVTLVVGFLLFRVLDVIKPPPARWLETLPRGTGIMADDLMAGAYANLLLQAALWSGLQLS